MTQSTTCKKVMSLLALYIDNKLDFETREFVERHLEVCPECNKKYHMLKDLIFELRKAYNQLNDDTFYQEKNTQFNIKEHEKFQNNISAYFDNELQLDESLNMKKYMIKFPKARQELEDLYLLHNIIFSSFNNTKKNLDKDYSKIISYKIQGRKYNINSNTHIKVASYAISLFVILSLLFLSSPLGKTVINKSKEFFIKNVYVSTPQNTTIVIENK